MPGCVLLGVAGSVDAADIEQQKKRRFRSGLHACFYFVIRFNLSIRSTNIPTSSPTLHWTCLKHPGRPKRKKVN